MSNYIFNILIYLIAIIFLIISFVKNRKKTKQALIKAWKSFQNILPMFLGVVVLIAIVLSIVDTEFISRILGEKSGALGVLLASIVGSATLIPGFIAFPTAAMLLQGGAGYVQIAAFVQTLMMVGIVTLPLEIKYFNKKAAIIRNSISFILSIGVAYLIGFILGAWK
ncbi:MAG: permease [Actinomycetota bacterium]|nr:permease [Actinomycetota bacterium]